MSKKAKPKHHTVDPVWLIQWYQAGEQFIGETPEASPTDCSHEFENRMRGTDTDKEKRFDARCGWDNGIFNWRQRNDKVIVDEFD